MASVVEALLIIGILSGGWLCWFSFVVWQQPPQLGRRPLAVVAAFLGLGILATAGGTLSPGVIQYEDGSTLTAITLTGYALMSAPWLIFTLQYTGTAPHVSRRQAVLIGAPTVGLAVQIVLSGYGVSTTVLSLLGALVFFYVLALTGGGCYLLVQTTRKYESLSGYTGVSLSVALLGSLGIWNLMSINAETSAAATVAAFDGGALCLVAGFGAAYYRYDLFDTTPAAATLGEDALIRETDDLMFVVDADGQIITSNRPAAETFGVTAAAMSGSQISDHLGEGTDALAATETVSVATTDGTRQYDPQLSTVADPHGNPLGTTVSLRDVTNRELRQQRLAVLNRMLRHNLRNRVDIVKGHTETLPPAASDQQAAITEAIDDIASLGRQARQIDRFIAADTAVESVDLTRIINTTLERLDTTEVRVTTDLPETAALTTNRRAIQSAITSPLKNATEYAETAVSVTTQPDDDGYRIVISDDGPGIPAAELDALESGAESQLTHTTGMGLWQLKWAVMTVNGEISFTTDDGTTVDILIPDRSATAETS